MRSFLLMMCAVTALACGSSSDSTGPGADISGNYILRSANGHALPTPGNVPIYGNVQILSGSGSIHNSIVQVEIVTTINGGSPGATGTFQQSGVVTGPGPSYTFKFVDGTSANANCSSGTCTVAYASNTFVFELQ